MSTNKRLLFFLVFSQAGLKKDSKPGTSNTFTPLHTENRTTQQQNEYKRNKCVTQVFFFSNVFIHKYSSKVTLSRVASLCQLTLNEFTIYKVQKQILRLV